MVIEFWGAAFLLGAVLTALYLAFELGRMTKPSSTKSAPSSTTEAVPSSTKSAPSSTTEAAPLNTESYPAWFCEWVKHPHLGVNQQNIDDLYEWACTLAKIGFTEFGGAISAKKHLYPWVRERQGDYQHIPHQWRSLHALFKLQQAWQRAGLVEIKRQKQGAIFTDVGIDALQADPDRWYP